MKKNIEIDNYINNLDEVSDQELAKHVRKLFFDNLPDNCEEKMSYQMPGYYLNGPVIYFAIAVKHVGIYPTPEGVEAAVAQGLLDDYKYSKGAIQIPKNDPQLDSLIKEIIKLRVAQKIEE